MKMRIDSPKSQQVVGPGLALVRSRAGLVRIRPADGEVRGREEADLIGGLDAEAVEPVGDRERRRGQHGHAFGRRGGLVRVQGERELAAGRALDPERGHKSAVHDGLAGRREVRVAGHGEVRGRRAGCRLGRRRVEQPLEVRDRIRREVLGSDPHADRLRRRPVDVANDHGQHRHRDDGDDEEHRPENERPRPDADEELATGNGQHVRDATHDGTPGVASVVSSCSSAPTRSTKTSSSDGSATSKRRTSPPCEIAACRTSCGSPPDST